LEDKVNQPHRRKVWLKWNSDDVARIIASSLFDPEQTRAKYLPQPYGMYAFTNYDTVLSADRQVGLSTVSAYTVNLGQWYSLGMIDEAAAQDGSNVEVVWGEENGGTDKPTVERHGNVYSCPDRVTF
jgi:glycine cleavage system aminomethyltransferase T